MRKERGGKGGKERERERREESERPRERKEMGVKEGETKVTGQRWMVRREEGKKNKRSKKNK